MIDLRALCLREWKTLLILALVGMAAGAVYSFVAPKWYQSTLAVVPSQPPKDVSAITAKIPFAADAFSVETDVRRIHAVFSSNSVLDEVIDKFSLQQRYNTDYREQTRAVLQDHCAAMVDRKSGVVTLTCEDKDPKTAKDMASYFGEVGNAVFRRISASSAHEERRFLEAQVESSKSAVEEASKKLRDFQEKNKIIDLPEQTKATISAMASLEAQMLSKQLELGYLNNFASSSESNVVQLQKQLTVMKSELGQLESKGDLGSAAPHDKKSDFFPDAMMVPSLRFELEQLIREQKIQETLFFLLTQRYEMAKVDEARDTPTFQILDYPTVPTHQTRPQKVKSAILGFVCGLAGAVLFVFSRAWMRARREAVS